MLEFALVWSISFPSGIIPLKHSQRKGVNMVNINYYLLLWFLLRGLLRSSNKLSILFLFLLTNFLHSIFAFVFFWSLLSNYSYVPSP